MMNEQDAMVDDQSLWDECHAKTVKFLSQCEELRKHMYQLMGQQEKKVRCVFMNEYIDHHSRNLIQSY